MILLPVENLDRKKSHADSLGRKLLITETVSTGGKTESYGGWIVPFRLFVFESSDSYTYQGQTSLGVTSYSHKVYTSKAK